MCIETAENKFCRRLRSSWVEKEGLVQGITDETARSFWPRLKNVMWRRWIGTDGSGQLTVRMISLWVRPWICRYFFFFYFQLFFSRSMRMECCAERSRRVRGRWVSCPKKSRLKWKARQLQKGLAALSSFSTPKNDVPACRSHASPPVSQSVT